MIKSKFLKKNSGLPAEDVEQGKKGNTYKIKSLLIFTAFNKHII